MTISRLLLNVVLIPYELAQRFLEEEIIPHKISGNFLLKASDKSTLKNKILRIDRITDLLKPLKNQIQQYEQSRIMGRILFSTFK